MFEKLFKPAFSSELEISQAKEAERQQQLQFELEQITALQDQQQLCRAAIDAAFSQARQAAAQKLENETQLHDTEKESRDKSVQHIVREKLKYLKQQQQEQEQAQREIEDLCKKLEQLSKGIQSPLFKAQYEHICTSWKNLSSTSHQQAKQQHQLRFDAANETCQGILTAMAEEAAKCEEARKVDEAAKQQAMEKQSAMQENKEQNDQEKQQIHTEKEEHQKQQSLLERSLLEQITSIEKNLEQGIVANISKKISSVQKKLDTLDAPLAKLHEGKVQLLKNRLNELRDWQSFAALPKKQELCAKMQALVDKPLDPPALAKTIQSLQHQWRELKGGGNEEEQKLWEQFKEISDKAYEPCKHFFDNQRDVRAENLKQREKVCQELEQFQANFDWTSLENGNGDWKAIDKIIEAAKNEFFRLSPIDHKHQETIKQRYHQAITPLIEKLRPEQKKNETERQRLIDQAKKLLESTDTQGAIQQAKQLQQQWKEIGITRPRENQKLWQQFRDACDAVFSKRNAERDQFKEQLHQELKKADEICTEIEALGKLPDDALPGSKQKYQELRQTFLSIHQLKKDKQKKLFSRFYQACDRYQDQVNGIKKRQQNSSLLEAFRKAALCDQLENGGDPTTIATQWESQISIAADIESELNKRYASALKISTGEAKADFAANEKKRRLLLIQLEILLDKPTPEEDKGLRMEHQLQQLSNKGMVGKASNKKEQIDELILKWIGSPAAALEKNASLQQRFETLIQ